MSLQKTNPGTSKLSFIKYDINSIGDIPEQYQKITTLDLSHNNICDIIGIEVFTDLQYLNLQNNQISDINNLYLLKSLSNLNTLVL